jgi:hypothetical protein
MNLLGPWEKDGERTVAMNKLIAEMIAVDLQPLSIVENVGFQRVISEALPKYTMPGRFSFTKFELPRIAEQMKVYHLNQFSQIRKFTEPYQA